MRPPPRLLVSLLLCSLLSPVSRAQDWQEKVASLLDGGRYEVALRELRARLDAAPADPAALRLLAEVCENLGKTDDADGAVVAWMKAEPASREARIARARQLLRSGERAKARELLEPLLAPVKDPTDIQPGYDYEATALTADILLDQGRRSDAETLFDRLVTDSKRVVIREGRDLAALARAYVFFGGAKAINLAVKTLVEVQKQKGCPPAVDVQLGRLYLERMYLPGDAVAEAKAALKKRPGLVDALILEGEAYASWMKDEQATQAFDEAASLNPAHPRLLCRRAELALADFQIEKASGLLSTAAKVNPADKRVLGLEACAAYMRGDHERYEALKKRIAGIDPQDAGVFHTIATVMNERRRWPEALALAQEGSRVAPDAVAIWDDVARYALCLGQNKLARDAADKADDLDNFSHPYRKNIWELLRVIGRDYDTVDTARFAVRLKKSDVTPLQRQVLPFLERSYDTLTQKYGFVPPGIDAERGKMLVEVFARHKDFSVRTVGFEGLGATGVCFGSFIAMLAPNAMPPGHFTWARTFHHEFTHTMTLGLSKGRVPRWLTEGLSTFEETEYDPSWTRGMDRELFDAFHTGELLQIADFDAAFRTPRIIYAYYQGGLESEYLVKTYGLPKVIAALRLFSEDLGYDAVFRGAFGVSPAEVDQGFRQFVAARIKPMKMEPRWGKEARARLEARWKTDPSDNALLVDLAWARLQGESLADCEALLAEAGKRGFQNPRLRLLEARLAQGLGRPDRAAAIMTELEKAGVEDFDLALDLGRKAERAGRTEDAMALYRRAVAAFPSNPDPAGPRVILAKMLRGGGQVEESLTLLEEHLHYQPEDLAARRAIIDQRLATGKTDAALDHLEKWILIDPLDSGIHLQRAKIYLAQEKLDPAALAADCAIDTAKEPVAEADARVVRAAVLVKQGRVEDARTQLSAAIKVAPQHAEARAALEKLGSKDGTGDGK